MFYIFKLFYQNNFFKYNILIYFQVKNITIPIILLIFLSWDCIILFEGIYLESTLDKDPINSFYSKIQYLNIL